MCRAAARVVSEGLCPSLSAAFGASLAFGVSVAYPLIRVLCSIGVHVQELHLFLQRRELLLPGGFAVGRYADWPPGGRSAVVSSEYVR